PEGDASLDGTVDYSDFQVLAANYGLRNAWQAQGDFNHDGVVNWTDLNILRSNLDPAQLTPSEFAQLALFGQSSVVPSGQALEYDGYALSYVSDMPIISSSNGHGPARVDETTASAPIWLGGLQYPKGLGVYGDSSVDVNLGGQYARFQSDIGVDG